MIPTFLIVLRCIRTWAKNRCIYGNKFGYLGGINCNLLVAKVCQLYPKFSPSQLLFRFFSVYQKWSWPNPIQLNNIIDLKLGQSQSVFDVWSKQANPYNSFMPIITPAYPASNSLAQASENSLEVMKREFSRGYQVVNDIVKLQKQCIKSSPDVDLLELGDNWSPLFEFTDFFIKYNHYLCCHIIGNESSSDSKAWKGFVESRIAGLIRGGNVVGHA